MGEDFAFFLPVMMATFSVAFLLVWRWGAREAFYWGVGYGFTAAAFTVPLFVRGPDPAYWPLVADVLFASAFLCFGTALLQRWRPHWMLPLRIGIWGLSILLCTWAISVRDLPLELVASDMGCFLLVTIPLVAGIGRLGSTIDRVLFAAICLVAMDNFFRATTVPWTIGSDDANHFVDSGYAFLMQALASVFGLFMGLAALAATVTDMMARLRHDAHVDPLSGLLNRRGFDHAVAQAGSRPSGCIVTCDIDHFKRVNDTYGHGTGDRVIVTLAAMIQQTLPEGGVAARFGGEEFILYLPRADAGNAARIAETLRSTFEARTHRENGIDRPLTASFGLAVPTGSDYSLHDAIARADIALYDAKRAGRNRLRVWRSLEVSSERRPGSAVHVA
ncbi:MAG TPA: GGDEF domain-containing protein [Sphingobium sp.]|uniref:GGDEF domain-containing protein n=1 Tax=Sphingobium sp. TaxID=1912891 RepID=UPI002ED2BAA5